MSDFGMVNIDRGIFNHPAFKKEPFTEREAWMWLIAGAVKKTGERRIGTIRVILQRGQLSYSHRFMAERWQWTVASVQRFLLRLVSELMIDCVSESGITCVTIRNYDKYQFIETVTVSPPASVTESENESPKSIKNADITGTTGPPACGYESANESPPSQIRENSSLATTSEGDGGVARARESAISEQAFALADDVMRTLGIDPNFPSPGWCGLAMWVQAGLASGWRADLVRIAVARVRARKGYEVPFTFKYLAKPIQREHQQAAEPHLPIPPVAVTQNQDSRHAHTTAKTAKSWQQSRDDFRDATARLKGFVEDTSADSRSEDGAQVIRLPAASGRR